MPSTGNWNTSICLRFVRLFAAAAKDNYKLSSIVLGIVNSDSFRKQGPSPAMIAAVTGKCSGENMFITKKHISRRTVLKGAGVALGLPFLDAMVPAGTALAQTAAAPKLRMGFFYMPHGAIMYNTSHGPAMDKWTPSGSGANFKLSPILASLEPYKKYVSSFGNLENAATAGSVHSFTPSTWLSALVRTSAVPRHTWP